ncbi:MAG TPA: BsuBI/PstI family type II restriction endonuclease [Tepidisphaeraceae bacterium]|nr:BsuBI/PstI family type II restriction endonuclease [Tepidisphaeraceae bacterium]
MTKTDDAIAILAALGLPKAQQNERSALTLLALAGLGPEARWSAATTPLLRTVDIMEFMRTAYGKDYKPNSRETIRRQTLHQFEQARLVDRNPDNPTRPTNSGKNVYQLTEPAHAVVAAFADKPAFLAALALFGAKYGSLSADYQHTRNLHRVPLVLPDGREVTLSPGAHNEMQAATIKEFGPRFAPGAQVLYLGDTAVKHVVLDVATLAALNIVITEHDKLPDIILYRPAPRWLYLIEVVTSHGPVSPKRRKELEVMLHSCIVDRIYVTVFRSAVEFRKYATHIAWETEVWLADSPDHLIHFNGDKFLGPPGSTVR